MSEWQPIDGAPKDGTAIIGLGFPHNASNNQIFYGSDVRIIRASLFTTYQGTEKFIGWVDRNNFGSYDHSVGFHPTHWMPLPETQK